VSWKGLQFSLLRHGETDGGARFCGSTDVALTDKGWQQMKVSMNDVSPGWDRIISSPLKRCAAFARYFAQQYAIPLSFDERIKEMHFGIWEGRSAEELMAEDADGLTRFWQDPDRYPPQEAERLSSFQARVLAAWNGFIESYGEQRILLVTHGGVIRVLLCHLQEKPIKQLLEIEVKHGSLHILNSRGQSS